MLPQCFEGQKKKPPKTNLDVSCMFQNFEGIICNVPLGLCALIHGIKANLNLTCFVELSVNYGLRIDISSGLENRGKMLILFVDCGTLGSMCLMEEKIDMR